MTSMLQILSHLRKEFSNKGLDICEPFKVKALLSILHKNQISSYNEKATKFALPISHPDAFGVVVGSTKNFWQHFINHVKQNGIVKDPVDDFSRSVVQNALKSELFNGINFQVRFDTDSPVQGKFVHIQTAGHVAGVAHYDKEVLWSVHQEYGLWFIYRAVIIFPELPFEGKEKQELPSLLDKETKEEMKRLTTIASNERWMNISTRLAIRDCCPIGKEKWRYEGDMLDYFYPIKETRESVLKRCLNNIS